MYEETEETTGCLESYGLGHSVWCSGMRERWVNRSDAQLSIRRFRDSNSATLGSKAFS